MLPNDKVLITGGCGFIGLNIVEFLLQTTHHKVHVLDNLSTGSLDHLKAVKGYTPAKVSFFNGDIRNQNEIAQAIKGCKYVIHLAAQTGVIPSIENPLMDAYVNIIGTLNMLEMAVNADVKKFIFSSSAAPLGEQIPPLNEQKLPQPLSPYGASKLSSEAYCSAYSASFNLETVVLRFSNVYGPKSYKKGSVVAKFIKQLLVDERVEVFGTGQQTRDYIHVADICNAIYQSMKIKLKNDFEIFQIGSGMETTVNQLFSIIKEIFLSNKTDVKNPIYKKKRQGEIYRNYADIRKANQKLGYYPSVELTKGIEETIKWFIDHYKKQQNVLCKSLVTSHE